jgi:pSer/pThr/pTyr-binding forkhead associated (FHA) protein
MASCATIDSAALEPGTERVDALACLDERTRRRAAVNRPTRPGRYIEIEGPQQTLVVALARGVTHIGRGPSADLRLDDVSVSRRHAVLIVGAQTRVLDDRSANGTFVNGRAVEQAQLTDGDVLGLGAVALRYLEVSAARAERLRGR